MSAVYRGVMLYGDSGTGKSSLINAGLMPEAIALGLRARARARAARAPARKSCRADLEADGGTGLLPTVLAPRKLSRSVLSIEEFVRD